MYNNKLPDVSRSIRFILHSSTCSNPLLSPPAAHRRFRRLLGAVVGLALVVAAPTVRAQTVYGLGIATGPAVTPIGTQLIGSLNVATSMINLLVTMITTGVTTGQVLIGMDS